MFDLQKVLNKRLKDLKERKIPIEQIKKDLKEITDLVVPSP